MQIKHITVEKENLMDGLDCTLDVNRGRIGKLDNISERDNQDPV